MKHLLFLTTLALALVSCDSEPSAADPPASNGSTTPQSGTPATTSSPETESPTKSRRPREITPRSKPLLTGKWHPENEGHVISPYTDESLFAIGVISGSKVTDAEGNEFIVPPFGDGITKYPTGKPIPKRPGFLFNPFTKTAVDARGIPPETLLRDPNDSNPDNKFRTPPAE